VEEELRNKLFNTVSEVLQIDPNIIHMETSIENTLEWDSFAHLAIVTAVEAEFDISLDFEEMFEIDSMKALLNLVIKKIG